MGMYDTLNGEQVNVFLGLAFMCQQWTQRALSQVMVEI